MTKNNPIENHAQLRERIAELNNERINQEKVLAENFKWLYESMKPEALIETAIDNLKEEEDSLNEVTHLSIDYLTRKYLTFSRRFRGSVGAIILNEALHFAYNRYQPEVRGFFKQSARNLASIITPKRKLK